ncbi:PIN domain-containing protein [Roseateles saccharophilus]|uniref:PIN domain-containing protein n=1 Tax=Roseateles saccharophilus TaxID=304 RepID=A0A4R3ULT8_ROSSA|nr:PIN domain-containing protein [Roseateles saccharophilus]MDG0833938.1 nucleotide-binding protein [Roseateles saccharophilus]TCU91118.1 PIN domain-containing protein [Roseateles saccharophilus]
MRQRAIVLDANILIRAVLGQRVRELIVESLADVSFFAPDTAFDEARKYLPGLLEKRGVDGVAALATLDALEAVVRPLDSEMYRSFEQRALARIGERDADDWPALACALMLDCPVWTEDADFFGTGVATWTTSRVKLYLSPDESLSPEESAG